MSPRLGARPFLMACLSAAVLASTACKPKEAAQEASPPPVLTVSAEPVSARTLSMPLELTGAVSAWESIAVQPGISGLRIVEVLADENQTVRQGQLLARLDDASLQAQLAQARAQVASAQAQVASAQDTYDRFARLRAEGGVSESDWTARRTTLETSRASLLQAQAALRNVETQLAFTRVTAPTAGKIVSRAAYLGDVATVGKALFQMVREGRLQVEALVPESDLGKVKAGQTATIVSDARPDLKATGRVRLVTSTLDPASRQATVKIDLPPGSGFEVGMFVRARLEGGRLEALSVPAASVTTTQSGATVFVLEGDVVHARPVTLGVRDGAYVAVLSGLANGERIVTAGGGFLKDGDRVTVADETASPAPGEAASPEPGPMAVPAESPAASALP